MAPALATAADQPHRRRLDRNGHDETALTTCWKSKPKPEVVAQVAPTALDPSSTCDPVIDRFCVYGVANDYQALLETIRFRILELQTTHEAIDTVSGLHSGYTSTIAANIKSMGRVSMGPMLQTLGLALIIVRDDEQFARVKDRLARRNRPDRAIARRITPKWLFKPENARQMGKKRWQGVSDAKKARIMKKISNAAARARRRKARQAAMIGDST